jgi:hypothetical protein
MKRIFLFTLLILTSGTAFAAGAGRDFIPDLTGTGGCNYVGPDGGKSITFDRSKGLNTDRMRPNPKGERVDGYNA